MSMPEVLRTSLRRRVGPDRWRRLGRLSRRVARPALSAPFLAGPLSREWGFDRGTPVDRWYIEHFVDEHRSDVCGSVLEIKSRDYTDRFGQGVTRSEVLDIDPTNEEATLVTDLAAADRVAGEQFDCFLLNQTLQLVYDHRSALAHAHRLLKPGGVLLVTVPSISRVVPRYGLEHDFWRYTPASCLRLFDEAFPGGAVTVSPLGNVRSACAFLNGVAAEELSERRLRRNDPYFPVVIGVRAEKAAS